MKRPGQRDHHPSPRPFPALPKRSGVGAGSGTPSHACAGCLALALTVPVLGAFEKPPNFKDDILPILDEYCIGCHRGSRARNGLKLDTIAGVRAGGSGGTAVVPGDPDGSLLYQVVARTREPFMPWEDDPLPGEHVATLRDWIAAGAPESADSVVEAPTASVAIALTPSEDNRPAGAPAMPETISREPAWWSPRADVVVALAASPWAPLVAVGGERQAALYHAGSLELLGVLAFDAGSVKQLRFSRNGEILLAAGGQPGRSGSVIGWDVRHGGAAFQVGDEPDVVLAADLSNDHLQVALGGPDTVVRVYETATGKLLYELTQHTDWITSVAFSPDGVLLATGDRNGGVFVWESLTGRTFHALPAHGGAVTGFAWRSDSRVLVSAGDDGALRQYDLEDGRQLRQWTSHGGVLALATNVEGRLVTAGRDGHARTWGPDGSALRELARRDDLATACVLTHDGSRAFVGGWDGRVLAYDANDGALVGDVAANPEPSALRDALAASTRHETLIRETSELETQVATAEADVASVQAELESALSAQTAAVAQADEAEKEAAALRAEAVAQVGVTARLATALATRRARLEERSAALASATSDRDAAQVELQAVVEALIQAEARAARGDGASSELEIARKLADGATARAQLTAARVAEVDVEVQRWRTELARWESESAPDLARAAAAEEAASLAESRAATARAAANEAATRVASARERVDQERGKLVALEELTSSRREAAAVSRSEVEAAQSRWETLRAEIVARGGRVSSAD